MPYFGACYNICMVQKRAIGLLVIVTIVLVAIPALASAAGGLPTRIVQCGSAYQPACGLCDIATLAQNVLNTGIFIAVFLSAILFAWAGWKYVTAGGGGDVSAAREIFTNVLVGLVIILAAWLIVDTIMRTLVNENATIGPWNKMC